MQHTKPCPTCQKEVGLYSVTCPHCSRNLSADRARNALYRKMILLLIAALLLAAAYKMGYITRAISVYNAHRVSISQ